MPEINMDTTNNTPIAPRGTVNPQWMPLPPPGLRCAFTGMTRSRICRLLATSAGAIRQVSLREPGRKHGTRLVHVATLLAYLETRATTQAATGTTEPK